MPGAPNQSPGPAPRAKSGVVVPNQPTGSQRLAARLIWLFIRSTAATVRIEWDDRSRYFDRGGKAPVIFAMWHNRLALSITAYRKYPHWQSTAPGIAALVSASKDGALLSAVLEAFGAQPVRGSTSRRGRQALLELTTWAERGYDLAITPDGPRGPCYQVQEGVIAIAQLTGLTIAPVSYELNRKVRLKSWDRFQVPLPFARCRYHLGPVMQVPRDAGEAERDALRRQLEQTLREITVD